MVRTSWWLFHRAQSSCGGYGVNHWKETDTMAATEALKRQRGLTKKIKQAGDQEIPMDDAFYDRLHDQIMAAVEETEINPLSRMDVSQQLLKRHWRNMAHSSLAILAVLGIQQATVHLASQIWSESHTVKTIQNEKQILNQALLSPEEFLTSMMSSQSQSDLIFDVASQDLDQITQDRIVSLMGESPN